MGLQATRRDILRVLLRHPGGARLKDLTDALGISNSAVLNHIGVLQRDQLVTTMHEGSWGRGTRYFARPALHALWVDPRAEGPREWTSPHPVDWRFPLVSRIPDEKAQALLHRWLDLLQVRQALPQMRSKYHPQDLRPPLVSFVVYGSCARGDAGRESDVDILVYTDGPKKALERVVDLAHEASLGAGRAPDIRAVQAKDWTQADPALRTNIHREGITVFSTDPTLPFLEDMPGEAP